MSNDTDTLAHLLYTARHRSRRLAKRCLREAGGQGSAEELDEMLSRIAAHPRRAAIERQAEALREAGAATDEAGPTPIDFRAVIRDSLERRGWNAKQLADAAGVANPQVYRYLSGERGISDEALARLLTALGVTVRLPRARAR